VLVMTRLMRMDGPSKLYLRKIRFNMEDLKGILRIGVPAGLQSTMFGISNLIVQSGINSFGSVTVAAWTAHGRMDAIVWMISGAFSVAITTFVGQNFGAQKYDRVRKSVRVCLGMSIGVLAAVGALLVIFARPLFGIFSGDPVVIEEGMVIMLYITPFYWMYMPVEVFSGAMRGVGESLKPMIITCLGTCVLRMFWVVVVVGIWHTVPMLTLTYPVAWFVTSIIFAVEYLKGDWMSKRIEALGMAPEIRPEKKSKRA
jgi:Na+-driven multidrug efflux pump